MPPPDYLIENILPEQCFAVLFSAPAVGKTFLALDWALHVGSGTPWCGLNVKQASVVYIIAEGQGSFGTRVTAWRRDKRIVKGVSLNVPIWRREVELAHVGFPQHPEAFWSLFSTLTPRPRLIVVDTLARCMPGKDENSAQDMGAFIKGVDVLRATGAAVLVLHHEGHLPKRERGSSALRGAADELMRLERDGETDLVLSCIKHREGDEWTPVRLRKRLVEWDDGATGRPFESLVLDAAPPDAASMPSKWLEAIEALRSFGDLGATSGEWFGKCSVRLSRATFYRMAQEVVRRGLVERIGMKTDRFRVVRKGQG